ncbi:hypothetical protein Q7P37_004883 [Cladosporium fusiforme]
MAKSHRTVLVTGCSEGGMGAELAKQFRIAGFTVYATARDSSKMKSLQALGINVLSLDISSEASIEECVGQISSMDILVNNAGASYTMPIADISIQQAKALFDANVWGHLALTQSFLPLLLKSPKAIIVNHTSVGVGGAIPFQSAYNASKAAMSMFSDVLRLELQPFDIAVVNLKTGGVKTNIVKNVQAEQHKLPEHSIYAPARDLVEKALRLEWVEGKGISAEEWAREIVHDLQRDPPPPVIYRGESAWLARFASLLPLGWVDGVFKRMTGLDKIEREIRHAGHT